MPHLQKAEILFKQLSQWNGSYNLAGALEQSDRSEVYEKVKEIALHLEKKIKIIRKHKFAKEFLRGEAKNSKVVEKPYVSVKFFSSHRKEYVSECIYAYSIR